MAIFSNYLRFGFVGNSLKCENYKLFDIITNEMRVIPHFHLSIQAGDNDVLKAMRRRHTREDVIRLCNNILNYIYKVKRLSNVE